MRNKEFIQFPVFGFTNPVIIRKDDISHIYPDTLDQLQSKIYLKTREAVIHVDEPTSSIEGRL